MRLKKWLLGLVTFAAMAVLCAVCAGAETYGDYDYSVLNDGTVEITDYNGSAEKIDIPKTIDGKTVTKIGISAFEDCTNFKSITIPDSVTEIGWNAFSGCKRLISITIPDSVTEIGWCAFQDCARLTSITLPYGVASIGVLAFSGCTSLTSITIPDGVTSIERSAFYGCESLTSITIPDSVTEIGDSAFWGCVSLTSITIPDSVTEISFNAFSNCTSLTSVTMSDSVKKIGKGGFYACRSLTSITIPDGVTSIGVYAFGYCTSLTSITIPDNVMYIDDHTFSGCSNLKSIEIPNSVTELGDCAFYDCRNLINITIPNSVTSIGEDAFGYYYDESMHCSMKYDDFKIYCYPGTAGEKYAKDNGFDYELIKAEKLANVTGFKVKSLTSTNVTLQWNKNANASGYEIEQYKGGKWVNVAKITSNATTSFTIKGLAAGTAGYKFRMRAVKDGAYSDYTSALSVNTNPYGVGGFKCSSKSSTSVTLKWNKGTTASGYQLQQYKDGKWVTIYTGTKATDTSYTVKKLKAGTAGYRFRIRAYKTYGNTKQYGSWSSEVKVNTNPYGVSGFKCSSKTSTSVTLKWNKGTTASGYQLQQYKDGKWVTIYTGTKATNTSFTVKKLKAGTAGYRFRIRAYKTYGNTKQYGSWSSEVKVNTNPYGVSGFKAKSTAKNSITLGWNKGTTASGYQLQQYKDGKWVTVYTGTKATSTSCTVKSLKANTSYKFRIRAYKTYGNAKQYGSWSKELTVKTKR